MHIYICPPDTCKGQHAQLLSYRLSDIYPCELCEKKSACSCMICRVVFMITGSVNRYAYSPRVHYNTCPCNCCEYFPCNCGDTPAHMGLFVTITCSEVCP